MNFSNYTLEFLLKEHYYRPVSGNVVTIGRQTIDQSPEMISQLLRAYGCVPRRGNRFEFEFDGQDRHGIGSEPPVSVGSLLAAITDCEMHLLDRSDDEGADIVCDLCTDLPTHLYGKFDFVVAGGSLDAMFDPVQAIRNMCDLLKPGGRIFICASGNSSPTSYLQFSPDWLMDYFAVNEWADCKTYVLQCADINEEVQVSAWCYDPFEIHGDQLGYECSNTTTFWPSQTICIAERGQRSTTHCRAVQKHYRGNATEPCKTSAVRFRYSSRPLFRSPLSVELDQSIRISPFETMQLVAQWAPTAPNNARPIEMLAAINPL